MQKLQVLINGEWKYVFCRNPQMANPITTENKSKAIAAHKHSMAYFASKYANHKFQYSN